MLVDKLLGQQDVLHVHGGAEQRGDLLVAEARNTAAYAGDEERVLGVLPCEGDELVHVRLDGLHAALHRGYAVALALQPHALSPHRAEALVGQPCGSAAMCARQVAAEHEHLVRLQTRDSLRCKLSVIHNDSLF